jgi:hypothetical protein
MPSNEDIKRAREEMAAGPPASLIPPAAAGNGPDMVKAAEAMEQLHAFAWGQKVEASADSIAKQAIAAQNPRDSASRFTRGMN